MENLPHNPLTFLTHHEEGQHAMGLADGMAYEAEYGVGAPMIAYGETTKTEVRTVYWVEAKWPDGREFNVYNRWAFHDRRWPKDRDHRGNFEDCNQDVSNVPERVSGSGPFRDVAAFSCPVAAKAYADRLQEFGQPAAGWKGPEEWRKKYRRPIQTRVVEERMAMIKRVVLGTSANYLPERERK